MGRTCGEPDEIKKNTQPKYTTALFRVSRYTVSNVEAWQQLGGDIKGAAMMDRFGDTVSLSKVRTKAY